MHLICSNLGALAELVKDNTKNVVHQTQQQVLGIQAQLPAHHQIPFQQTQQAYDFYQLSYS